MTSSFDISKVDVEHFLEVLEVENVSIGLEEANFSCPFPGHQYGDSRPSAYMNLETTAWKCHGCKRSGNAITFLADHENVSRGQSALFLRTEYEPDFREPVGGSMRHEIEERFTEEEEEAPIQYLSESFIDRFNTDWTYGDGYMLERGFSPNTLSEFEIGYDLKSDRFTIPVFDFNGELLGFKGRAWKPDHQPKYLILGDRPGGESKYGFQPYEAKNAVFGLDKAIGDDLIMVEGEFNVMAMHQMGFRNTIGLGGSNISWRQHHLVVERARSVVLFFDFDNAGIEATLKAIELFEPHMRVRFVGVHEGDPADHLKEGRAEYVEECISQAQSSLTTFLPDVEC